VQAQLAVAGPHASIRDAWIGNLAARWKRQAPERAVIMGT